MDHESEKKCIDCNGILDCLGIVPLDYPNTQMLVPDRCTKCAFSMDIDFDDSDED